MNNKGQSLVVFVLLLPLIIILIALITDLGSLSVTKKNYENQVKSAIEYGLKHLDDENLNQKLTNLLEINIQAKTNINIENEIITITVTDKYKSIFSKVLKNTYDINITYIGYIDNGKIRIEKD
ncbi:MAG: hypothetical protein IJ093_00020 [Bacilli bacterium]|nr:hypothetical protein [Bacilli bacterium]